MLESEFQDLVILLEEALIKGDFKSAKQFKKELKLKF